MSLTVGTDMTKYRIGQAVRINGFVNNHSGNAGTVWIQIQSEEGIQCVSEQAQINSDNSFHHEIRVSGKLSTTGAYRVRATCQDAAAQTSFLVVDDNGINTPLYTTFFFADIVGLSDKTLNTRRQIRKIDALNNSIRDCEAYRSTTKDDKFVLPTGDGVAIGFIRGSELALQLSVQLHEKLREYNSKLGEMDRIHIRIGINAAPVYLVKDLLDNMNVWGDGIILAKRVMDVGTADHILLSSKVAEDLMALSDFNRESIHLIGEFTFKHGEKDVLYSAYGKGFGNPVSPGKTAEEFWSTNKERINLAYYNNYENSVYFYDRRENLPSFSNLLSYARKHLIIAAVSLPFDPASQRHLFVQRLNEGMKATIILPDPDSRPARSQEGGDQGMKERIAIGLAELRKWREEISNKQNLFIATISNNIEQSLVIIDPEDNERALIQVEYHQTKHNRIKPFEIVFKKKNAAAFNQYFVYYRSLESKAHQYIYS